MAQTKEQKAINKIKKKTIEEMTALGVYKPEFSATINAE